MFGDIVTETQTSKRLVNTYDLQGDCEMTPNLGTLDRSFRLVLGVVLLAAPFVSGLALLENTAASVVSVVAGLVMVATSTMKFCPLYRLFGIRTCKI